MSKSSLLIGLIVSVLVHATLFVGPRKDSAATTNNNAEKQQIARIELPVPQDTQQIKQEEAKSVKDVSLPKPVTQKFREVVKAKSPETAERIGDYADEIDEDSLPTLRLVWDSPEHLIDAAKNLGLKVLPVNSGNKPIGELIFERDIIIGRFQGGLSSYSNRVRTIDAHFFGSGILSQCPDTVRYFWIVVPASIDQRWVETQKQALISHKLKCSDVSYMEAKLIPNDSGFELVITKIVPA